MLSPYTFCDTIFHMRHEEPRIVMAELALNLYFGAAQHPFDVSRIFGLIDRDRLDCIGAIGWVSSQPRWDVPRYMHGDSNYLQGSLESLLVAAATSLRRPAA
jgi:hypothetical protein